MPLSLEEIALAYIGTDIAKARATTFGRSLTRNLQNNSEDMTVTGTWEYSGLAGTPVVKSGAISPRGDKSMNQIIEVTSEDSIPHMVLTKASAPISVTAQSPVAVSIYARSNSRDWLYLGFQDTGGGGGYAQCFFSPTSRQVGTFAGSGTTKISTRIEDAGDGIWRCKLVALRQSGTSIQMYVGLATEDAVTNYAGTGASIFVWGAQVENNTEEVHDYAPTPVVAVPFTNVSPQLYSQALFDLAEAFRSESAARSR